MAATHYHSSSKGDIEIASLDYRHAVNARDKLARMGDPARGDELEALSAHVEALEAAYKAEHPEGGAQ